MTLATTLPAPVLPRPLHLSFTQDLSSGLESQSIREDPGQASHQRQAGISQPVPRLEEQQSLEQSHPQRVLADQQQQREQQQPSLAEPVSLREAQAVLPQPKAVQQPQPKPKPVVSEIQLSDEVTIRQLAQQLDVPAAQVEQALLELGERPSSHEDVLSPENAELAAMSFGKTVVFSQAFLVSLLPRKKMLQ